MKLPYCCSILVQTHYGGLYINTFPIPAGRTKVTIDRQQTQHNIPITVKTCTKTCHIETETMIQRKRKNKYKYI